MLATKMFSQVAYEFIHSYDDDVVYMAIAKKIVDALPNELISDDHSANVRMLQTTVITQIDNQVERQIAVAFFHPGGSQREALNELMLKYYDCMKDEPSTPPSKK
jgi:hypothetical protein